MERLGRPFRDGLVGLVGSGFVHRLDQVSYSRQLKEERIAQGLPHGDVQGVFGHGRTVLFQRLQKGARGRFGIQSTQGYLCPLSQWDALADRNVSSSSGVPASTNSSGAPAPRSSWLAFNSSLLARAPSIWASSMITRDGGAGGAGPLAPRSPLSRFARYAQAHAVVNPVPRVQRNTGPSARAITTVILCRRRRSPGVFPIISRSEKTAASSQRGGR